MKPLRAGVIGLGVGERHLAGYVAAPESEIAAICDTDPVRLKAVGERWQVRERFSDWRRITEHPDIDVVSICSYDDGHTEQAISALQHGKHVMLEKPVALYRPDLEALVRAHQDSNRKLTSNLILRRSPRFIELKEQISAGYYGELFYAEGDYVHDILWKLTKGWRGQMAYYNVIFGGGIHLIDLMRWLFNDEVTEVCSMGTHIRTRETAYRYDDTIVSLLRFAHGAMAKSLTTFGPRRTKFHALNVYGTERTFINDLPHAKLFSGDAATDEEVVSTPYPGMMKEDLIPDFLSAIREDREPNVSARDVFRVMDICFAAVEGLGTGRTTPVSYTV